MKNKNMRKVLLICSLFFLFFLLALFINVYFNYINIKNNELLLSKKVEEINNHYNDYVITNKKAKLYKKESNIFVEYGEINEGINLTLKDKDNNYFFIDGLDLYVNYSDVTPVETYSINNRYKNYIYFNKNIVTNSKTSFYDEEANFLYTINKSFDFEVLLKSDDYYGVVHNNRLVYIKSEEIEKIYDNINTTETSKDKIRTLTYHFIYNQETSECDQSICQSFEQFESHLKYIREHDYFTLNMREMELYLDGNLNIPNKSIVLTVDDGTIFDVDALKLLEKYNINMTMFVITFISENFDYFKSEYLDLESHTNYLHNQYECPGLGNQGGGILCVDEEKVLNDLKLSQDKLGGSKYFAYPFFDFNDRAISLLKRAGFNMAFIGQYTTDGYAYPNVKNKYMVPRKTIFSTTTMDEFISYLN